MIGETRPAVLSHRERILDRMRGLSDGVPCNAGNGPYVRKLFQALLQKLRVSLPTEMNNDDIEIGILGERDFLGHSRNVRRNTAGHVTYATVASVDSQILAETIGVAEELIEVLQLADQLPKDINSILKILTAILPVRENIEAAATVLWTSKIG